MARRSKLAIAAVAAAIVASMGATSVAVAPDSAPNFAKRGSRELVLLTSYVRRLVTSAAEAALIRRA